MIVVKIKEIYLRWIGIPILTLILSIVMSDHDHKFTSFGVEYLHTLVFTVILWNGCFYIIKFFRSAYADINQTPIRLFLVSTSLAVWLIVGSNAIALTLGLCELDELLDIFFFLRYKEIDLAAGFMVASVYESSFFFSKWKEAIRLNEELKNQQIRTQFEVLQNQMSPHFLFNSLNTLTALIAEDQKVAIDFTQTLSEVYRYILQNKERELVSVHEELEFCTSYIYLLKKRYPENLHVKINIDQQSREKSIAPLTLQMLVENAIKHNVVSKTAPLYVELYIDDLGELVVKNNLQVKKSLEKSTKTGLDNIRKRYQYLGNQEIKVITSQQYFRVTIPLIEVQSEVEYLKQQEA